MADSGRLEELKRKFDENPRRYFAPLANEYRKAGNPDLAIELCRTYLPQLPTHMSGYIVYGQALQDAGHVDESEAVFKQALTLDPENIIALRNLGDIARNAGDRDAAVRWYGKVLELDPRSEEVTALVASLTQAASAPAAPLFERQAPPAIRPEPAPDDSAVRLEDIVSEPDVAQAPLHPSAAQHDTEQHDVEPSDEPFELTEWPVANGYGSVDELAPDDGGLTGAAQPDAVEGPWHSPESLLAPDVQEPQEAQEAQEPQEPLHLSDYMPDEDAAFAPAPDDAAPAPMSANAFDSDAEHVPAAPTPVPVVPSLEDSPFVTETMADLYMQQGLRGEALGIYRQLALKRDDARLRQRIAEIEAEQASTAKGETVRAFFARIGARRPDERVERAEGRDAQPDSSLSALFATVPMDERDLGAAQRLSGAFSTTRRADPRS
jgi:tetratricopeptide (TPR) repeat protein